MSEVTITPVEATQVTAPQITQAPAVSIEAKPSESLETPKVTQTPKESASDSFLALARKEKAIVKARQEISAQKAEFEREKAANVKEREEYNQWKQLRDNAKLDPDAYLNAGGITYGSLTERNLKGGIDPNAILEKANQTISNFEKRQEEARKTAEEAQKTNAQKEYEDNLKRYVDSVNDFVETNKETYELITLHNQQHLIWEVQQAAGQRGQVLTTKQAADKVEQYLDEQVTKALNSKKYKDKYTPIVKEEPVKPGSPTLSNNITSSTPTKTGFLTEKQRIDNAMAVLNKFDT